MLGLFFPNTAYASVDTFVANINRMIINPLIKLLFALAIAYFLWGVYKYFANPESEEDRTQGRQHMLWGIIGIVVMMGVFTIINLITSTFGLPAQNP